MAAKSRKHKVSTAKRRGKKRKLDKLEMDDSDHDEYENANLSDDNQSDDGSNRKRVRFSQDVNDDASTNKYAKYGSVSMDFPKISDYLKIMVEDNEQFQDLDDEDDPQQLWLFHFPPGFDHSLIENAKFSVPKYPEHGQRVGSLRISSSNYQIIEYDCSQNNMVNLFAVNHKLKVGKPFERHFHVLPDLKPKEKPEHKQRKIKDAQDAQRVNAMLFGGDESEERAPSPVIASSPKKRVSPKKKVPPKVPSTNPFIASDSQKVRSKRNRKESKQSENAKKLTKSNDSNSRQSGIREHFASQSSLMMDDDQKDPEEMKVKKKKSKSEKKKKSKSKKSSEMETIQMIEAKIKEKEMQRNGHAVSSKNADRKEKSKESKEERRARREAKKAESAKMSKEEKRARKEARKAEKAEKERRELAELIKAQMKEVEMNGHAAQNGDHSEKRKRDKKEKKRNGLSRRANGKEEIKLSSVKKMQSLSLLKSSKKKKVSKDAKSKKQRKINELDLFASKLKKAHKKAKKDLKHQIKYD